MYLDERKLISTQQFGTFDYNLLLAENQFILDRAKIKLYFQAFWVNILFDILSTKKCLLLPYVHDYLELEKGRKWTIDKNFQCVFDYCWARGGERKWIDGKGQRLRRVQVQPSLHDMYTIEFKISVVVCWYFLRRVYFVSLALFYCM